MSNAANKVRTGRPLTKLAALVVVSWAGSVAYANDLFLPNALTSDNLQLAQVRVLSNDALIEQASMLRSSEMSAEHRALNHQWLAVQSGEMKQIQGSKVFSKIAKQAAKQYWRDNRKKFGESALLPDSEGKFKKPHKDIDYDIKISGGGLRLGFQYEFQ